MQHDILDFVARIAWPMVALIAIIFLGPLGVLRETIGELADKLFKMTEAVNDFKKTATEFNKTQELLKNSSGWVGEMQSQLASIADKLDSVRRTTQEIDTTIQESAIIEGSKSLGQPITVAENISDAAELAPALTVDDMYDDIRNRWQVFSEQLKQRVGAENFDARMIGAIARHYVDGRRARPLTSLEADRIERLHSQMKRFNRLQSSRADWLTHEVYSAFVKSVEQAIASLRAAGKN
jgi:membrane-bound lytic murein transglycosylase MltF